MSKNVVEPGRPQTIWRMCFACCMSKATHTKCARARASTTTRTQPLACTHTQNYVIRIAFLRWQWFRKRASVLRYTYIASLVCRILNSVQNDRECCAAYFLFFLSIFLKASKRVLYFVSFYLPVGCTVYFLYPFLLLFGLCT